MLRSTEHNYHTEERGRFLRALLICCSLLLSVACDRSDGTFANPNARQAAAADANVAQMLDEFAVLVAWHAKEETGLMLSVGRSGDVRQQIRDAFACEPSAELVALWQWHDGEADHQLFWYHQFMSLDEASSTHATLSWTPFIGWHDRWIPFAQFQDEWMFVECGSEPVEGLPVGRFLLESGAAFGYDNLTRYVQTLNASIIAGALTWQDEWWLEAKPEQLGDIHRANNQHGDFPYAEP